jgi:hypothetical protein
MKLQDLVEAKLKPEDLKRLAIQLQNELKRMPEGRYSDIKEPELHNGKIVADIRYWGHWVLPHDAEYEEDYDWKELDKNSGKVMDKKVKEFAKANKVKISWSPEEKEYIALQFG